MTPTELMNVVVRVLESLGVPYAVTGSMASTFYGEMRTTNDVDIVVDLPLSLVDELIRHFPSNDYYISEDAARQAIQSSGQFNIIHPDSGLKVDIIISKKEPHDIEQLRRAQNVTTEKGKMMFVTPEDIIIKKLWFYQLGESEKHLRDIASILKISSGQVDRSYIAGWAETMGFADVWEQLSQKVP